MWNTMILGICRLGFAGLSPVMPGTCGTAVAAVLAPFLFIPLPITLRILALLLIFWLGGIAASQAECLLIQKDPGEIVIDELLGMWLVLLPFQQVDWKILLAGFLLFRFFDMLKPWPVNASEDWLPDGFGVMLDDVLAGLLALAVLLLLRYVFPF